MNESYHNIEKLKNKVIDVALIAFSSLSVVVDISSFLRAKEYGLWVVFIIQTVVITLLVIVTVFRKKLTLNLKVYSLIFVVLSAMAAGLYGFGFLGSSKVLIAILPVFISFIVSYRKALISLLIFSLVYGIFAFLYSTGKIIYLFDLNAYATNVKTWLYDYLVIFLTSWGLLYVSYHFGKAITENYSKIELQNIELIDKEKNTESCMKVQTMLLY